MFSSDFKELLSAFNEHHVKYLIVGGYAVAIHAQPRATKDLDIFVQPKAKNAEAVYAALVKFGAPMAGLKPADLIDPNSFFRLGVSPQMIEILPQISGVKFDEAWQRRIEAVIDEQTGLRAFVISAEDFITNKLAAARLQDLADVEAVRKAAESQSSQTAKKKPTESGSDPNPNQ
ncbi:DUF6036 family nucleotidyltransferase [Alloacidobacterium sp.]|uniref:DUF6036 family nucleotidyltransferase n=1 Tax=Alloacidobacterium sp. TaxID=2951999 RepID=UPI002D535B81|nr:DUF6036 family nucleotidyltransferase [Alloacidobacterium sp.]HYK36889.1 DUF6036 family nucleotidyltransferase [Alloacidobacterium sp.]